MKKKLERDLATHHNFFGAANLSEARDKETDVKDDSQAVLAIDMQEFLLISVS